MSHSEVELCQGNGGLGNEDGLLEDRGPSPPAEGPPLAAQGGAARAAVGLAASSGLDGLQLDLDAGRPEVVGRDLVVNEPLLVLKDQLAAVNLEVKSLHYLYKILPLFQKSRNASNLGSGGDIGSGERHSGGFSFWIPLGLWDDPEADVAVVVAGDLDPLGALNSHGELVIAEAESHEDLSHTHSLSLLCPPSLFKPKADVKHLHCFSCIKTNM